MQRILFSSLAARKGLLLLIILLLGAACGLGRHPAIGSWRGGPGDFARVSIYDDGTCAVMSVKCVWKDVDGRAVRIEMAAEEVGIVVDFRVHESGQEAKANLSGLDVTLRREQDG